MPTCRRTLRFERSVFFCCRVAGCSYDKFNFFFAALSLLPSVSTYFSGRCSYAGGNWSISAFRGLHHRRSSSAVQRHTLSSLETVRVPGDFDGRLHRGSTVRQHHSHLHRSVLCRNSADLCHLALRQGRGAQLPGSILCNWVCLYSLVYCRENTPQHYCSSTLYFIHFIHCNTTACFNALFYFNITNWSRTSFGSS